MRSRLGRDFNILWVASAISNVGDGVRLTALPLLGAYITKDPVAISTITVANRLPWLVFSIFGGAISDRFERIGLMRLVQLFRTIVMVTFASAVAWGSEGTGLLYTINAVAFLLGITETIYDTAAQAALPAIVDRAELERANGRLYATELLTNEFLGPPIGAFLFAAALGAPFVFDSVTFALAAALLLSLGSRSRPRAESEDPQAFLSSIKEGLRWAMSHRLLRVVASQAGTFNLVFSAAWSISVLFVLQVLDGDEGTYGTLLALIAVAQAAGLLLGPRIVARLGRARCMTGATALTAASTLGFGLSSTFIPATAFLMAVGFAIGIWNVVAQSMIQRIVPQSMRGRVLGSYRVVSWGGLSIGAFVGGVVAGAFGLRAPWFVACAALLISTVVSARYITDARIEAAEAAAT